MVSSEIKIDRIGTVRMPYDLRRITRWRLLDPFVLRLYPLCPFRGMQCGYKISRIFAIRKSEERPLELFWLSDGAVQIEIIGEAAIFPRLDILPVAMRATRLRLRKLSGGLFREVFVPAWHWFLLEVILSTAPENYFSVNHWPRNRN